jgi:hypothetical protein
MFPGQIISYGSLTNICQLNSLCWWLIIILRGIKFSIKISALSCKN